MGTGFSILSQKNGNLLKTKFFIYWKPLTAIFFWGVSFIATKYALRELNPFGIIFCRLILASILLGSIAIITKRNFSVDLKNHGGILILSLIAVFHLWIQVTGLKFTTASNTGWIIGVTPVFMAILGFLFLKEKLNLIKILGILISFAGLLLLISGGNLSSINFISDKGDFLILASAFTWSVYSIVNKKIMLTYPPLMTIFYLFVMMSIIVFPFAINAMLLEEIKTLSAEVWISIIFLGLFCSGIAYVLWSQALKEMESSRVGVFLYFEPFVTVIAAWILLNESLTILMFAGGVTITIGVVIVNFNSYKLLLSKRAR